MEMEAISKMDSGYSSVEAPKVSVNKADSVHVEKSAPVDKLVVPEEKKGTEQQGEKKHVPSEATISDAVKSANRKMEHTRCEYSYHKETNRVSIKVINDDTDEVIREIPPEKSLDMLQKMWEMAGILVDEKR